MAAQPIPQPAKAAPKTKSGKLKAVPARQKPLYDSTLDRDAVRDKLISPRRTWGAKMTRFYTDAFRLANGAAQAGLLLGIFRRTIEGSRPPKGKPPEWTPPMLAIDFAREMGFTDQMIREALKDALARGLILRKGEDGPEAHCYQLAVEQWEKLANAFGLRSVTCAKDGGGQDQSRETTVSRVSVGAGRSARLKAGDMSIRCTNELLCAVDITATVPHGEVELKLLPATASETGQPAEESGAAVIPLPQPAASDQAPKSKPGRSELAPVVHPSSSALVGAAPDPAARVDAPAVVAAIRSAALPASEPLAKRKSRELLDVAAESIQECMADLRVPIMLAEAREVAAILHRSNADSLIDIAWFCAQVQQRAARDAKSRKPLTFPVLKLIAQDAARELWPQEAARRAKGGSTEPPETPSDRISKRLRELHREGKLR
jgi:hypothetical protein